MKRRRTAARLRALNPDKPKLKWLPRVRYPPKYDEYTDPSKPIPLLVPQKSQLKAPTEREREEKLIKAGILPQKGKNTRVHPFFGTEHEIDPDNFEKAIREPEEIGLTPELFMKSMKEGMKDMKAMKDMKDDMKEDDMEADPKLIPGIKTFESLNMTFNNNNNNKKQKKATINLEEVGKPRMHKDIENASSLIYLAEKLADNSIDYCVAGNAAMIRFGSGRAVASYFQIFMTPEGYETFKATLAGKYYRRRTKSGGTAGYHYTDNRGVQILVSLTTDVGWQLLCPKTPREASHVFDVDKRPVRFLDLQHFMALKMHRYSRKDPGKQRDLSEVRDLIKKQHLTLQYAEKVHPLVRTRFKKEVRYATEEFLDEVHNMFWTPRDTELRLLYLLANF